MVKDLDSSKEVRFDSREGKYLFMALIVMFYAIARLMGVGVHEFIGHGLFTEMLGGEFYAAYISPGNGYASIYLPGDASQAMIATVYLAGIFVELVLGLIILFLVYPRMKRFTTGLFVLVLSEILLVHSSFYLVLGSYISSGDSYLASRVGGVPIDLLIISGLILAGFFILLISVKFLQFISEFAVIDDDRKAVRALGLFWLPPLFIIWASILMPGENITLEDKAYSMIYGTLSLLFIFIAMIYIPKMTPVKFGFGKREGMRLDRVITTLVVFIVVVSVWLAVFGPTSDTAHGLMLKDPPMEAERYYRDFTVGNAIVYIGPNDTVSISIILKGVLADPSPLDEKLYDSFEQRPYWQDYENGARNMIRSMFLISKDVADNISFEQRIEGDVWASGDTYGNARVSQATMNLSDLGMSFDEEGNLTIQVIDPWMVGSNPGYLDGMEFRWNNSMTFVDYETGNIRPTTGNGSDNFMIWRNPDLANAPTGYEIILRATDN